MNQLMINFYKQYYSANNMTLVVLGKETIDVLFNSIIDIFEAVPSSLCNDLSLRIPSLPDETTNIYTFDKILMKQQSIQERLNNSVEKLNMFSNGYQETKDIFEKKESTM